MNTPPFVLKAVAFGAVLFFSTLTFAQSDDSRVLAQASTPTTGVPDAKPGVPASEKDAAKTKRWSVYWGWNRSNYSESDISFRGADHNFTIKNVAANDMQVDLTTANIFGTYLSPGNITLPQTNLRVAYQWDADTVVALNLDHMKYVMAAYQTVPIVGNDGTQTYAAGAVKQINPTYLNFEHTDGLNVVSLEYEKQRPVDWFGAGSHARVFGLVGLGFVYPKSNVTLNMLNRSRYDEFHMAGYSVGAGAGVEVDFWKDYFVRTAYKVGYVTMHDIVTSSQGDRASQHFTYNELLIAAGVRF